MSQSDLIKKLKILANDLIIDDLELIRNKNYKNSSGGSYFKFPTSQDVLEFRKKKKKILLK